MKKIFLGVGILALIGLSACDDKNETVISQEAQQGSLTFLLESPQENDSLYVLLEENEGLVIETLSYEKPDYGFNSATPIYSAEVSLDSNFVTKETLKTVTQSQSFEIESKELNTAILNLHAQGDYPDMTDSQKVYLRMVATLSTVVKPAHSNYVMLNVLPYEITNVALPSTYYIIGLGGNWNNSVEAVGTASLIPLSLVPDYNYNPSTGKGEFVYNSYFKASESFKLVGTPGDWADAWGMLDSEFTYGSGDNMTVPTDGYYTITLNTEEESLSIEAADLTPQAVQWIEMVGNFSEWDAAPLVMTEIEATNGTVWTTSFTLTEESGVKFRADGDWSLNWGGSSFPYGQNPSGDNIPAEPGTYQVVFNRIDNCYFFFKK